MRNIFKKKIMKIFNFYGSGDNKLSLPLLNIILELYQTAKISFDRYSAQKQNGKDAIGSLSSLLRHDLSQYIDIRLFSSDNCQKTNTCVIMPMLPMINIAFDEHISLDIDSFLGKINMLFPLEYGFSYSFKLGTSPFSYAMGADNDLKNVMNISRDIIKLKKWLKVFPNIKNGAIRDIYIDNFLNENALNRTINDISLKQWIMQSSSRGSLKYCGKLYHWTLPATSIEFVRDELSSLIDTN